MNTNVTPSPPAGANMKTHLGHYQIVSELGRGGMGVVYKAFEPALNRHVAIKELSPSLAHDPQLVERFLREARSMAALSDPHIIQVFYIGTDEGSQQPFFAMEYVEGESLSTVLKRDGKLGVDNALKILHQTAQGLATAHDRGVIHRDIKPGNLMLTLRGQVKIADFGIALATTDISKKLTSTGEFVGTPGYLSPEVCLGKPIDQRSDIFSLGIVLFEMLSGRIPFSDESPLGLMLEVVKSEIPDIQQLNGEVDPATTKILARMVAKEPTERFQSCHDLVAALDAHPLLAHGNTIKLARPVVTTNAATMIGTAAPVSQPRAITPPPVVRAGQATAPGAGAVAQPALAPAATAKDAGGPVRPSVLDRPAGRRGALWLPITAAAVLVLAVAGGAFAFRGTIMDFMRGYGDGFTGSNEAAYDAGRSTGKATNPVSTSVAGETPAPATGTLGTAALASVAPGTQPGAGDIKDVIAQDRAAVESTPLQVEAVPDPVPAQVTSGMTVAMAETPAATPAASHMASTGMPMASSGEVVPVPVAPKAQVVANATPRPVAAPVPQRVVVIALGDSALTGPASQRIARELSAAGFDLVDADALGVDGSDSLANAIAAVKRSATVAIVVRAEPMGSQQLQYYGRTSELYIATLSVRAYRTADRSMIGSGLSEKVQFTLLNADTQAESALSGKLDRLVAELSPFRRRG